MKQDEYIMKYAAPVGLLTIASDGTSITGLWMEGQKYYAATLGSNAAEAQLPVFERAVEWLNGYFRGERPERGLPLAPKGSEFRKSVWQALCAIPYGEVTTYGDIAKTIALKMGKETMSAQAVGGAVGHNPISILIPCHRVVGMNGSLTGYAGGIDKKIKLLKMEGIDIGAFSVPARGTAL